VDIDHPVEDPTVDTLEPVALDEDPFDDDLAERLEARAPFQFTRTTVVLAGLVLVVAGFVGGVLVQQNYGTTGNTNGAANFNPAALASRAAAGGFRGGTNAGGNGGAGTGGGAATSGTITLVDGTTVYVTTSTGDVVIVKTSASTTVQSQQTLAVKDLKVGTSVTVRGTTASDGSVTATSITSQAK
jgi:hypothetical protein